MLKHAPKAGALPDCATPRRAETLRLDPATNAIATFANGSERQNASGTGDTDPGIVPEDVAKAFSMSDADRARFNGKQDRSGECWNWTGAIGAGGYGLFKLKGRSVTAHRLALKDATGEDRPDLQAAHSCNNVRCCNPDHLRWATNAENQADKRSNRVPRLFAWNILTQRMAQ